MLEVMAMLTGLLLFGNVHVVVILDEEGRKQVAKLQALIYLTNKATYLSWIKYFKDGAGKNSLC